MLSDKLLTPTWFLDYDDSHVAEFVEKHTAELTDPLEKAIALFRHVRDDFPYDPYRVPVKPEGFRASRVIEQGYGFCITKAVLLTAVVRAAGIRRCKKPPEHRKTAEPDGYRCILLAWLQRVASGRAVG